jgi:hypothetical protein
MKVGRGPCGDRHSEQAVNADDDGFLLFADASRLGATTTTSAKLMRPRTRCLPTAARELPPGLQFRTFHTPRD